MNHKRVDHLHSAVRPSHRQDMADGNSGNNVNLKRESEGRPILDQQSNFTITKTSRPNLFEQEDRQSQPLSLLKEEGGEWWSQSSGLQ